MLRNAHNKSFPSALYQDGEDGYIRWVDAGYATGLRKRLRAKLFQFLAAFITDCRTAIIIQPCRNSDVFFALRTCGGQTFLMDVAIVMGEYLDLLDDIRRRKRKRIVAGIAVGGTVFVRIALHIGVSHTWTLQHAEEGLPFPAPRCSKPLDLLFNEFGLTTGLFPDLGRQDADAIRRIGKSVPRIVLTKNQSAFGT